ncbi:MAG: DUF6906 family protein [Bacillota bacterium]
MKNGKKPNRQQQVLIENNGLNPTEWLIFKKVAKEFHLVHRVKGTKRVISA